MKCQENASFSTKTYISDDVIMNQSQTMHVEKKYSNRSMLIKKAANLLEICTLTLTVLHIIVILHKHYWDTC